MHCFHVVCLVGTEVYLCLLEPAYRWQTGKLVSLPGSSLNPLLPLSLSYGFGALKGHGKRAAFK